MAGMGWITMLLLAVIWIIALAALAWWGVRIFRGRRGVRIRAGAEEILRERFARGEIDRETYQRMRSELERDERAA